MLFKKDASPPPWFLAPLLLFISLLPLWEAWAVASKGTIAAAHCNGFFSGSLCGAGLWIGRLFFGGPSAYLGYVIVSGALGAVCLYMAWSTYIRFRTQNSFRDNV